MTQTRDERWAARDVMPDCEAHPTLTLRPRTRLHKMSHSRGLSMSTQVKETTQTHLTYKH